MHTLANPNSTEHEIPPSTLAAAAFVALRDIPESSKDGNEKNRVSIAFDSRYSKQGLLVPSVIYSAMALIELFESRNELAKDLMKQGPTVTSATNSAKDFLRRFGLNNIDEQQIAGALLFMILTPDTDSYRPATFVAALRDQHAGAIDWQKVVKGFDRENLSVSQSQFLSLYRALLPIAEDASDFDIQLLWGGHWTHAATQLSFAIGLASLLPSQLDATTIPRLRQAYDPGDCLDGPEDITPLVEEASRDPMISSDAVAAIIEGVWKSLPQPSAQDLTNAKSLISEKMTLFLCSASAMPKPWVPQMNQFLSRMAGSCLLKEQPDFKFILHVLWKQDRHWLVNRLIETHSEEPIKLPILLEHALEHGWLEDLCTMMNGFGIDLAALAHRKGLIDLHEWAQQKLSRGDGEITNALSKFLIIKAQDEMRTVRMEQPAPRTVSLAMKTVHAMLGILEEHMKERRPELNDLERQCMQAFPRLCNYGEGFDELIEANGAERNTLPPSADADMQDYYKRMYSGELDVRNIIEGLRDCKNSDIADKQELFACMIHGLFDEFVCFGEYPLNPLATTAVLFGGIINYRLISNFVLHVALEMVLESVRDYLPESPMYKFGLQALLHFLNRLSEWPEFCQQLVQIPGLQGSEPYARAQEVLRDPHNINAAETNGMDGLTNGQNMTNGNVEESIETDSLVPQFRSVNADTVSQPEHYEDPPEEVQDQVLFALNNVSEQNLTVKITDISGALEPRHYQWFASYLVEQRAKSQPNYQQLYLDLLGLLNDKGLWADVLRETYVSVRKVLNADSTMKSAAERTYLKNLGTWLGSLTIARDKPIKHKNIAFKDLLIEGWETSRLLLVIPFTCEVLAQGLKSIVFKPPNPWVMEIICLLLEFYDVPDLGIQRKFAIEKLLATFDLPRNGEDMERSNELKKRQQMYNVNLTETAMPDGTDGFEDMAIGLGKDLRTTHFTPPPIPDLDSLLVLPPSSNGPINQLQLRHVVSTALERSIQEIIGPVVERSVTIATIATKDLIHKDYAQEPDEDRVREAFEQMARSLASSLAAVTCKEPLRMSMTNYIRALAQELADYTLPEGALLMCVNDNLEMACRIVEKQAEERALPEIEPHFEIEIAKRRQHKLDFPNEPYRDPVTSHWSTYIPEPYKQVPGGLNQEQLDIYQHFAPQARGIVNHIQTPSTDSVKQILPDVLQEPGFPNIPNLPTPADVPAVPHQPQSQQSRGRLLPPSMGGSRPPSQVNGYVDGLSIFDHIQETLNELARSSKEEHEQFFRELTRESPISTLLSRIVNFVESSPDIDQTALQTASLICQILLSDSLPRFEAEVLAHLLKRTCQVSHFTASKVIGVLRNQADEKMPSVEVTAALLAVELLDFTQIDMQLARALRQQKEDSLRYLSGLLDAMLFASEPVALRADFVGSLGAMGEWLAEEPTLELAKSIISKLKTAGIPESTTDTVDRKSQVVKRQMQYIYEEWIGLSHQPDPSEAMLVAFINQLHQRQVLDSPEDMALFLRLSIEASVDAFEHVNLESTDETFDLDALSRLIVLLVKNQGDNSKALRSSKPAYMKSILSLVVLVLNNHYVMRGGQFNQRAFYRLFSSIFYDWHDRIRGSSMQQDREMVIVFAETLLLLDPNNFPTFTFGWLGLVSHRIFLPAILKLGDKDVSELFTKIMEVMLSFVGELLNAKEIEPSVKELYRGVLRVLLVLHHDFPEFLADNHFRLCNTIPPHCPQLRNLVLSAFPSSILELPDPFSQGLKVDRLEEMKKMPYVSGDIIAPLRNRKLRDTIDNAFKSSNVTDETISRVLDMVYAGPSEQIASQVSATVDFTLLHAIVLYTGHSAVSTPSNGFINSPFDGSSPQAELIKKLSKEFNPEARYYFLSAFADQLRYPNSHTHWFSSAVLHLFGTDQTDQQESDVRQHITRVLVERLVVHRPHPWGLIITLLELLKNPVYVFWELPFIKAAPEVSHFCFSSGLYKDFVLTYHLQ